MIGRRRDSQRFAGSDLERGAERRYSCVRRNRPLDENRSRNSRRLDAGKITEKIGERAADATRRSANAATDATRRSASAKNRSIFESFGEERNVRRSERWKTLKRSKLPKLLETLRLSKLLKRSKRRVERFDRGVFSFFRFFFLFALKIASRFVGGASFNINVERKRGLSSEKSRLKEGRRRTNRRGDFSNGGFAV